VQYDIKITVSIVPSLRSQSRISFLVGAGDENNVAVPVLIFILYQRYTGKKYVSYR
jgi:hypothetical protein